MKKNKVQILSILKSSLVLLFFIIVIYYFTSIG